ncbi:FumA C-terminus/TtdB family hydratase beta subunit [Candidatus Omnitrophota bacterium]
MRVLTAPLNKKDIAGLKAGELVFLSGNVYTARDQAHARLASLIKKKKRLPLDLKDRIIYYCGPTPAPEGEVIGACGPTTSARMDAFAGPLLRKGLAAMIGKGRRTEAVRRLIKRHKAVYLLAPSGCGAYIATKVRKRKPLAFADLGPEAIVELKVERLPLIVGIDSRGRDIYGRLADL